MGALTIHAASMVCSLGQDMDTACAAARAGLTRLAEIPCRVREENQEPGLAVGHCVFSLTNGFEGDARLIRMHTQAVKNLFVHSGSTVITGKIGWFLALPSSERRISGIDNIPDIEDRTLYEKNIIIAPTPVPDPTRGRRIVEASLSMSGVNINIDIVQTSTSDKIGFAELIDTASQLLEDGTLDVAIVGGVDSLVDEPNLDWLNITSRLKSAEQPVGLVPGEAAALVLLTGRDDRIRHNSPALANILNVQHTRSEKPYLDGKAPDGSGLAAALLPLAQAQCANGNNPWLVTDQNGESYRASDWGHALVKLLSRFPGYQNPVLWYPALSFGDTGAASAVIGTCMVLQAFGRNYAPSNIAAIISSNDGPERASLLIEKSRR